jgi:hypothetical protein
MSRSAAGICSNHHEAALVGHCLAADKDLFSHGGIVSGSLSVTDNIFWQKRGARRYHPAGHMSLAPEQTELSATRQVKNDPGQAAMKCADQTKVCSTIEITRWRFGVEAATAVSWP